MAHRNRWFTYINCMVIFHGYVKQPDGSYTSGDLAPWGMTGAANDLTYH